MSTRALIVDDEPLARRAVRRFLAKKTDLEVVAECGDGESAVRAIQSLRPNLVFLDVQMPEMDGFQVLGSIGAEEIPITIFVTAYDRFALRAFDANAIDYLLKPVSQERLDRALIRAQQRMAEHRTQEEMRRLVASLKLSRAQEYPQRLAVPKNGRIVFVDTKNIDWIEAEGSYVRLHVGQREHEFRGTLTELEGKLCPATFLRIHRSTIVNIQRIKEIETWFHGYHRVLLEDGTELRLSRYQDEIARRLGLR